MKPHANLRLGLLAVMCGITALGCAFVMQPSVTEPIAAPQSTATPSAEPSPTALPSATAEPLPEIHTDLGTMLITRTEMSEVFPPGCTSVCMEPISPGHVFLVVFLESRFGGEAVSLGEQLGRQSLWPQVSVQTSDGFRAAAGGGGMLPELFIEFSVPEGSDGIVLFWADNPPVPLAIE